MVKLTEAYILLVKTFQLLKNNKRVLFCKKKYQIQCRQQGKRQQNG